LNYIRRSSQERLRGTPEPSLPTHRTVTGGLVGAPLRSMRQAGRARAGG